jgi:hypothetical protein
MDNLYDSDVKLPQAAIPHDVFEGVKMRMTKAKIKAQKTQQQIAIGASLLLMVVVVNGSLVLMDNGFFSKKQTTDTAEVLYNHYFNTNQSPFDEK